MEKYILVTFSNGERYRIPASEIAESRANYYAEIDSEGDETKYAVIFKDEYDYTMKADFELIGWANNNMNWEDIDGVAEYIGQDDHVDYEDEWCNADKDIIEE